MTDVIQLHETELLPDRPFTDPRSTLRDLAAMEFTLNLLRGVMGQPQYLTMDRRHQQIFWGNPEQQQHRLIVNDAPQLLSRDHFVLVGFFGNRRRDEIAAAQPIDATDARLVEELSHHQGLLTYCTCCFPDGTYGNTILFADEEAKLHWATSLVHRIAVDTISPNYYHHIRLHSGVLSAPLLFAQPGVLHVTKYYDFAQLPVWRAVRPLTRLSVEAIYHGLYEYGWQLTTS